LNPGLADQEEFVLRAGRTGAVFQILEDTPTRLAIKLASRLRSSTAVFDKSTNTARFERRTLWVPRGRSEVPSDEVASITVVPLRTFGIASYSPLVQLKTGKRIWLAGAGTQSETVEAVRQMRTFLGLAPAEVAAAGDDGIMAPHPWPAYQWVMRGAAAGAVLLVAALASTWFSTAFTLPTCDDENTRRTLNELLEDKKVQVEQLGGATTLSSSTAEQRCKVRADIRGGALDLEYRIHWNGWTPQVTIEKTENEVKIEPAQLDAARKAADEFLSLASQSHVNGRPPRLSEPTIRALLEKIFDVSELQGATLAGADIGRAAEWYAIGDRVGTVYILAGTGFNDIAKLPNDPALQRQSHRNVAEFAPEFARYLDFQVRLAAIMMKAVLKRNAAGDKAMLERPEVKREAAETRVTMAETLTGVLTTFAYDNVSDEWRRQRLKLLEEVSPMTAEFLLREQANELRGHALKVAGFMRDKAMRDAVTAFADGIAPK
jgi:hypothetical protein